MIETFYCHQPKSIDIVFRIGLRRQMKQTTIDSDIHFTGKGLHSGRPVNLTLLPAPEDHGIKFCLVGGEGDSRFIPALVNHVVDTRRCTTIGLESGVRVSTIEHLMAAVAGCGLTNVTACLDSHEVPALDGSSQGFFKKILEVGLKTQDAPAVYMKIRRPVDWGDPQKGAYAALLPSNTFEMRYTIDYPLPIGKRTKHLKTMNGSVASQLGASRTFCNKNEIQTLLANKLGLGGNEKNVVIFDAQKECYLHAVRYEDECLRHKLLDAFGDLGLAGMPIMGLFVGIRSGHRTNVELLRKVMSDARNYEVRTVCEDIASIMPGVDLKLADLPQFDA